MKKKYILSFVILLVCMVLFGCEENKGEKNSVRIGVTVYDQYDVFISSYMEAFNNYVNEASYETGINIIVDFYNAAGSQKTQNMQVEKMIDDGCDVICVNLVDRTDPSAIINQAKASNTPIVFFNRELVEEDLYRWDQLYFVGAKTSQAGVLQANLIYHYITDHPEVDKNQDGVIQYIMLEGEANHQDAVLRTQISVRTLESYGLDLEKTDYAIADWGRDLAKSKVLEMLKEERYFEVIISNNDAMALGAIDAFDSEDISLGDRPAIFGIDGLQEGIEALEKGKLQGTVYNDKERQAKALFNLSFSLGTGSGLKEISLQENKYYRANYLVINTEDKIEEN